MEIYQKYIENQWNSVNALLLLPSPMSDSVPLFNSPSMQIQVHASLHRIIRHAPHPTGGGGKQQLLIALALYLNSWHRFN